MNEEIKTKKESKKEEKERLKEMLEILKKLSELSGLTYAYGIKKKELKNSIELLTSEILINLQDITKKYNNNIELKEIQEKLKEIDKKLVENNKEFVGISLEINNITHNLIKLITKNI